MSATDDRASRYRAERERLIRELGVLDDRPHPEGRVFVDGAALRDPTASTMEGLRLRIRELTALIARSAAGEA